MERLPEAVSIFILPPSHEVLEMRLRSRSQAEGKTDEAEIDTRLNNARLELEKIGDYKFAIVNDVLEHAVQELRAIVLETRGEHKDNAELAESCLTRNLSPRLMAALASFGVHPEQV
jgi:guanylate kinase